MPIARAIGGDFKPAPEGTHMARCIGVISLGTQDSNSPQFKPSFKVMIVWEIPDEIMDGGKAMTVQKEYACFLSDRANLRHDLVSWRGREFTAVELDKFDVVSVLDAPCMVSVIHKTSAKKKVYAVVNSVAQIPRGITPKPRVNELVSYEIEQGRDTTFSSLPQWIQNKIAACHEWTAQPAQEAQPEAPPDDWEPGTSGEEPPPF